MTLVSRRFMRRSLNTPGIPTSICPEVIASTDPVTLAEHYAQRARPTATKQSGCLCSPPFSVRPFLEESSSCTGLLEWGIFNPYGPTLWGLVLIDVPSKEESLLFSVMLNPFDRKDVVYGLIPHGLTLDEITVIVRQLFHCHHADPHALVPDCLPSFVMPFHTCNAWSMVFREGLTHIAADEVTQFCRDEIECPNNPWGVASLQRGRAFEKIGMARAEKGGAKAQNQRKATAKELQAWWDIASKEEHRCWLTIGK